MGLLEHFEDSTLKREVPDLNALTGETSAMEPEYVCLKSYMDSGAARSVCPVDFGAQFGTSETEASRRGENFRTATGKRVRNQGARSVEGRTEAGDKIAMNYVVADIAVALDSVSQMCDRGAIVTFEKDGGHIRDASGRIFRFNRCNDVSTCGKCGFLLERSLSTNRCCH